MYQQKFACNLKLRMLENYEENPGTGKTGIQEPVSLLPQTREHVLLDINIPIQKKTHMW